MSILERYITSEAVKNLLICMIGFTMLFIIFDFFDRIDMIMRERPPLGVVILYFLYKIPPVISVTMPIAMLVAVLFTIGMLSKNSELTAMRAGGITILKIARPVFVIALLLSLFSLALSEYIVPHCQRRVRELYNIDIRAKDQTGDYSQKDIWWRSGNDFFTADLFDSRTNSLHRVTRLEVDSNFEVVKRTDSMITKWVSPLFGWSMDVVETLKFEDNQVIDRSRLPSVTLPIQETPRDFYDAETDPQTMSYSQLQSFIAKQKANGLPSSQYLADLYAKLSYPFVILICTLVALPFAIKPARSGSLAISFLAGLVIAFMYYVIHSFSLAMGRAEFWNPVVAAWMANLIMGTVGFILNIGAEAPE